MLLIQPVVFCCVVNVMIYTSDNQYLPVAAVSGDHLKTQYRATCNFRQILSYTMQMHLTEFVAFLLAVMPNQKS